MRQQANGDEHWVVWSRGAAHASGSAVPFDKTMLAVSSAQACLQASYDTPAARYRALAGSATSLRQTLNEVMPAWTHRQQSTQSIPDAREEYVYALLCSTLAEMQLSVVDQHPSASAAVLAQACHNAGHLKMVASQLACCPDACVDGYRAGARAAEFMAVHHASADRIGHALGWQQRAIDLLSQAELDTAAGSQAIEQLRQRNTTFETPTIGSELTLKMG